MYWKNITRNLKKASPGRRWGRRGYGKAGRAERIIDVDLIPSTTRHSRLLDARERAARALTPLWALLLVAGMVAAFFIAKI